MAARVLYLITELSFGGAQSVLYRLVEHLDRSRFEPWVACLYNGTGSVGMALLDQDIPVFEAGTRHKIDLVSFWRLFKHIRQVRPAILHAHMFHANLPARVMGRLAGVPVIVNTEHTMAMESEWRYRLNRWTAPLADRVIAVSTHVQDFCLEHIRLPAPKLVLIPNGIDVPAGRLPSQSEARRSLDLPQEVPLLGVAGRLHPVKGIHFLIEAISRLDNAWLAIAGEGIEQARLETLAQALGVADRVCWLGFQEDIWQVLPAFDLYVQPSLQEGLPVTVLEAMAAGLPVVATQVGGTTEVVLHGQTGLLVPPGDPGALAGAARELLASPSRRTRMGQAGRERVLERFSLAENVRRTEALYAGLLAEKGQRV